MAERIRPDEVAHADQKLRRVAVAVDQMIATAPRPTGDYLTDQLNLVQNAVLPAACSLIHHEDELDMAIISITAELLYRQLR